MENNRNSIASTILNYLLQLIGVAAFYWFILYTTTTYWLHGFLLKISKVRYEDNSNFTTQLYMLLLIYVIFCYLANRFLLDLYHRRTARQLILSIIVDYLIWPLQILIVLIWNNTHIVNIIVDASVLFNVYIITALLIVKSVITLKLINKGNGINSQAHSKAA
ncbi:MAG TPA: hypothetical protein VIM89_09915 [Mucilaginibacter sp.]